MTFGTFDGIHPGHKSFLKQAKKLGDYLLVVIARDYFVAKAKGKQPRAVESKRAKEVRDLSIADKVILGSKIHDYFQTLRTYKIDLIALGYDQKPKTHDLRKLLRRHRLGNIKVVRLRGLRPEVYKSSKLTT